MWPWSIDSIRASKCCTRSPGMLMATGPNKANGMVTVARNGRTRMHPRMHSLHHDWTSGIIKFAQCNLTCIDIASGSDRASMTDWSDRMNGWTLLPFCQKWSELRLTNDNTRIVHARVQPDDQSDGTKATKHRSITQCGPVRIFCPFMAVLNPVLCSHNFSKGCTRFGGRVYTCKFVAPQLLFERVVCNGWMDGSSANIITASIHCN